MLKRQADMRRDFDLLRSDEKAYLIEAATTIRRLNLLPDVLLGPDERPKLTEAQKEELKEAWERFHRFRSDGWRYEYDQQTLNFYMSLAIDEKEVEEAQPDQNTNEFAAIEERGLELSRAVETVSSLGLAGMDTQVRIAGLHEISQRCEALARQLGMQAIAEGSMTQVQLSRLLGVAELTVGRWMKAAKDQDQ